MILDPAGHIRPVFAFWLPVLFALAITVADHSLSPDNTNWLYAEHGVNETLQYLIAFAAVGVGLHTLITIPLVKWLRVWVGLATLGCFYIGMEEISWGQQIFQWDTPAFWGQVNDQNETNLHNTSSWADQKPRLVLMVGIIMGGLIFPLMQRRRPGLLPARFNTIYPSADLKWVAALTLLSYLSKAFFKLTGIVIYDRPSEINETYIYLFMLLYLIQLRWRLRMAAA